LREGELIVVDNARQNSTGLWTSPAVRAARLGGLCVVAGAGLLAAGVVLSRWQTSDAVLAGGALVVLPALALGALALHRASRSPHRTAH